MGDFIKRMGRTKGFKTVMFVFKTFMENFVETGSENTPSKVDIGPVNTFNIEELYRRNTLKSLCSNHCKP